MTDNPASKMVRVSTPLIPPVQRLCELHRLGHTESVVRGLDELIEAIESGTAIPLTPNESSLLAEVVVRLEHLESLALHQNAIAPTVGAWDTTLNEALTQLTQRLNRIENTIAPLIQALERVPQVALVEGVDIAGTDELEVGVETITPTPLRPTLEYPLSQRQLSERLGQPYSYYLQKERQKGKEHFESWSQGLDPDGVAWTFDEPKRRKGKVSNKALKFYPKV